MTAVYFDCQMDDSARRALLYAGDILVCSPKFFNAGRSFNSLESSLMTRLLPMIQRTRNMNFPWRNSSKYLVR